MSEDKKETPEVKEASKVDNDIQKLQKKLEKQQGVVESKREELREAQAGLEKEQSNLDELVSQLPTETQHETISGYLETQKRLRRERATRIRNMREQGIEPDLNRNQKA